MDRRPLRATASCLAIALPILLVACGVAGDPSSAPEPSPSNGASAGPSSSAPGVSPSTAALKVRLLAVFGSLWFCDPDEFPVARDDEAVLAAERFSEVRSDTEAWTAITGALGFDRDAASLPPDQVLAIYRQWKVLNAIELTAIRDGYAFDELFGPKDAAGLTGEHVIGRIDRDETVTVTSREPSGAPMCPICLARGTRILTPIGPIAVDALRVGMRVWTLDVAERHVVGTVLAVASTPVPATHRVLRLELSDGRTVTASPGHPLADGRPLSSLRVGDLVDGAGVVSVELIAYDGSRTFDLVVSGPTGVYLAGDGIPLASTIDRSGTPSTRPLGHATSERTKHA